MAHAWGLPAGRWAGMTREIAEAALKLHRDKIPLPEDYLRAAKEALSK